MRRQPLKVAPRAHGHRTARYWHQAYLPTRPSLMSVLRLKADIRQCEWHVR